jgi:hypothetical protein
LDNLGNKDHSHQRHMANRVSKDSKDHSHHRQLALAKMILSAIWQYSQHRLAMTKLCKKCSQNMPMCKLYSQMHHMHLALASMSKCTHQIQCWIHQLHQAHMRRADCSLAKCRVV